MALSPDAVAFSKQFRVKEMQSDVAATVKYQPIALDFFMSAHTLKKRE
jgi:hypothetical protein